MYFRINHLQPLFNKKISLSVNNNFNNLLKMLLILYPLSCRIQISPLWDKLRKYLLILVKNTLFYTTEFLALLEIMQQIKMCT